MSVIGTRRPALQRSVEGFAVYDHLIIACRYTGIIILRLSNSDCRVRDSGYENLIGVAAHNGDKKRLPCSNVARFPFPFPIHPAARMNTDMLKPPIHMSSAEDLDLSNGVIYQEISPVCPFGTVSGEKTAKITPFHIK